MIILLAHKNKQGNGAGMLHKTMLEVNNKSLGGRGGGLIYLVRVQIFPKC